MAKTVAAITNFIHKVPGQVYLWLAITIFAASNSVTRRLTEIGSQNFIDGRNPISFCNVLFVGNICASLILILIYWQQWTVNAVKRLSRKDWIGLIAVAILSGALAPGATFEALARTKVTNVIFIGRLEPPLILALSIWLLKEQVNVWEINGAIVAFAGVLVTVFLQDLGGQGAQASLGIGEILAAVGAVALATSSIVSKTRLKRIPLGIFTVFRTAAGTLIFFCIALYLYGRNHFMDIFSPFLWQWMLVYGAVIVAVGQLSWFSGLKSANASDASLAGAFNPIIALVAAYLILGEAPTPAQYIGGSIVLFGVVLGQIGTWRKSLQVTNNTGSSHLQEMETGLGFKGI